MTPNPWFFLTLKIFTLSSFLVYAETTGSSVHTQSADGNPDEYYEQIVFDAEAYTHPVTGACVVALVKEVPIYDVEVERQMAKAIGSRKLSAEEQESYRLTTLDLLIRRQYILEYLSHTKHIATQQEIDLEVSKATQQLESRGSSMKEFLASGKLDKQMLRRSIAWEISWNRYSAEYLTDENLKRFFKKNHANYDGTTREVHQILVGFKPEEADSYDWNENKRELAILLHKIRKGEISFDQAVQDNSTSPTKADGGRIGWLERTGPMHPSIHKATFFIDIGELFGPIESPHGLHIIKVTAEKPGTKTLAEVRDKVYQSAKVFLFEYTAKQQQSEVKFTGKYPSVSPENELYHKPLEFN